MVGVTAINLGTVQHITQTWDFAVSALQLKDHKSENGGKGCSAGLVQCCGWLASC